MSCLGYNKEKVSEKLSKGYLLPSAEKFKVISSIAKNDLNTFYEMIQTYEARMSVYKDAVGIYTVREASKDRLENSLAITDDLETIMDTDSGKAFSTEQDKHKIATTATVNAILGSIPYIKEIPRSFNLAKQKYTYSDHLPVTKTRQLLYTLYTSQGIAPTTDSLKAIIENRLYHGALENDEKRILISIYNYVFSPVPIEYKDATGSTTIVKSLASISKQGESVQIRDRARNYMTMFHTAIVAVNNFSKMMIVTEDGNVTRSSDDTTLFRMSSVNVPQINNLFDTLDLVDVSSKDGEIVDVKIKDSIAKSFVDNKIGVFDTLIEGKTLASFVYKNEAGQEFPINIPFKVTSNKESIIDVVGIYQEKVNQFEEKYKAEGYNDIDANEKAKKDANSILANPEVITFILDKIGYKGIISRRTIDYILSKPEVDVKDKQDKFEQNLDNLWRTIASGIVSISANMDWATLKGKSDSKYTYIATSKLFLSDLLSTIRGAFKYVPITNNPNNNNKAFQASSLVEEGLEVKEFDSFIISPTSFWKNNQWVAKQIMGASSIYRKASQYNGDGENVDVNNLASRAENVNRYVEAAQKLGPLSAFKNNPFVKGDAKISGLVRLDSYKKTKADKGKSHMSMNVREVHRTSVTAVVNELIDNYDFENRIAPLALVSPQVYSDKSFWAAFQVRHKNHDFFPIKNNKIDIATLLDKEVANQRTQDQDFTINFINEWNKMYRVDPVTGAKIKMIDGFIDQNVVYKGTPEDLDKILKTLNIKVPQGSPISAIDNKYYNLDTEGEGDWSVMIAPTLREKLLRSYQSDTQYKLELLSQLALDHNLANANNSNLSENNSFNNSLNKKLKKALDSKEHGVDLEIGTGDPIDLSLLMDLTNGFPTKNKIGQLSIKQGITDTDITRILKAFETIHPVTISSYFAHNFVGGPLNELLLGSHYQYKNKSEDGMMVDMLKRAVGAASPGTPLSLDENQVPEKEDLRLPRESPVLYIRGQEGSSYILGTGTNESVETNDGGSQTSSLAVKLIQTSMGGVQGLMPNSSIKFFYSHTDLINKDAKLIKYALHEISEEMLDKGSVRLWDNFKMMLGSMSLGRTVTLPNVYLEGQLLVPARTFNANESLFSIYLHIKTNKDLVQKSFPTDSVMLDLIRENPDLKSRFVHQLVEPSSTKTGQSLFHSYEDLKKRIDLGQTLNDYELGKIDNADITLQLDATHDPENGTVSKYSQAYTNVIQEGRTFEIAEELLNTLAQLVGLNLETVRDQFSKGEFDFENDFSISAFRLDNIREFKDIYGKGLPKHREDALAIEMFNSDLLTSERRVQLFVRSHVMETMEKQKNTNATYKEIESDNFSMQSPQIASLIESGVRAYINKKTVAMKFSGGNYILAPTDGLLNVATMKNSEGNTIRVLGKDVIGRREKEGFNVTTEPGKENLQWKLATKKSNPQETIYTTKAWIDFSTASENLKKKKKSKKFEPGEKEKLEKEWYRLRHVLQKELDSKDANGELIWEVHPGEVVVPFAFKTKFGIAAGMQPSDITIEYFERTGALGAYIKNLNTIWESMKEETRDSFMEEAFQFFSSSNAPAANVWANFTTSVFNMNRLFSLFDKGLDTTKIADLLGVPEESVISTLESFKQFSDSRRDTFIQLDANVPELRRQAENKFRSFQKSLDLIVGRIPSTGLQSVVGAKIIGFIESNQNTIWFPKELMMIQGADLDIDKAVVLSWEFDDNGNLIEDESPEGLKNKINQLLLDITLHPSNQIVSDSPVDMSEAKEEKENREALNPNPYTSSIKSWFGVFISKVLASEGKAMVGVVMNLYKAYNLIYFTDFKNQRDGKYTDESKSTVKPLLFNGKVYTLANIDPEKEGRQAWSFFSTLGNAATDNAKEMILGAIKANLQTGNIIGLLTCYGVKVSDTFDFLAQPIIQEVMMKIRHSTDIGNDTQIPLNVERAVKQVLKERGVDFDGFIQGNNQSLNKEEADQLTTLFKLDQSATELQRLASALGINREIPVTAYDRFKFRQVLENYINELFEKAEISTVFNLRRFLGDTQEDKDYKTATKALYDKVQSSFNILKVIDEVPDINMYLKSSMYLDTVIDGMSDKYATTETIIGKLKEIYPENKFQNITEDEFKMVVKFLEESVVSKYIQTSGIFNDFNLYMEGEKIPLDITSLDDIAKFQETFPTFLMEIRDSKNNTAFSNNRFFSALQPMGKATGKFIIVPNIQDMTSTEQYELQAALNGFKADINYNGKVIKNNDFRKMLFLYSLVNSKGKVSTTSFFELFTPEFKNSFGYTSFLNSEYNKNLSGKVLNTKVESLAHVANALTTLLPEGKPYFADATRRDESGEEAKSEKVTYFAKGEDRPPFVKARFKGNLYTYQLATITGKDGFPVDVYSVSKPIYRSITLSVSHDFKAPSHITTVHLFKNVNNAEKVLEITKMKANGTVPLVIKMKAKFNDYVPVQLQIGTYLYNPATELLKHKCN